MLQRIQRAFRPTPHTARSNPLHASIKIGWEDIELWGIVLHDLHRVSRYPCQKP